MYLEYHVLVKLLKLSHTFNRGSATEELPDWFLGWHDCHMRIRLTSPVLLEIKMIRADRIEMNKILRGITRVDVCSVWLPEATNSILAWHNNVFYTQRVANLWNDLSKRDVKAWLHYYEYIIDWERGTQGHICRKLKLLEDLSGPGSICTRK